jgi:hypothetical protein
MNPAGVAGNCGDGTRYCRSDGRGHSLFWGAKVGVGPETVGGKLVVGIKTDEPLVDEEDRIQRWGHNSR